MFGNVNDNPKKLPLKTLSDVADINLGLTHTPKYVDEGRPFLSVKNISGGKIEFYGCQFISEEEFNSLPNGARPQAGDVLFCRVGTIGKPSIITEDMPEFGTFVSLGYLRTKGEVTNVYLKAWMDNDEFMDQVAVNAVGSSQVNLNTGWLKNFKILVPPMEDQILLAEFLYQSDKSKFIRFKSQFIEMFGELGSDYKGWGLTTLGQCCELNPKRPRDIDDELMVSFVPMPAVSEDGKMDCSNIRPYKEVRKGFTYFAEDDVLFAKITPCMENGKGAVARGLEGGIGSGSTEFHVLRPIAGKSNPYWLYILTMFESFRVGARKVMTGTGGQLRVPIGYLNDYPITLPPIDLQDRFEEFVHQSDKSKFALQNAISAARETKRSIIADALGIKGKE